MDRHFLEYSGSSEGESALSSRPQSYRWHSNTQGTVPDHGCSDRQEDAEELMLSEFLLSLQSSAGYHADLMQASYTTAVTGPAPRGLGRRTTAAGKAPAVRRTVVHRRKRRDDLAGPCNHCGALTSPQWRKGPKGKPVLCNACGIRFLRNRTLTKVMPKKRRHGASGGKRRTPAAALAAAAEGEDDDILDDPMTAADEDMDETYSAVAAAAAAQAYAASMQPDLQQQPLFLQSSFTAAAGTALPCTDDEGCTADAAPAATAAARISSDEDCAAAPVAARAGKQCAPAVPSVSRDSLFSTRSNSSSRNLMAQLGDCPSLTLALALHQQQQQRRQQEEQDAEDELQQQSSKYCLPSFPELQLFPPSSPLADSAGTGFAYSPVRSPAQAAAAGASSPVCSVGSFLQLQHQHSSSGTPPLSPLFLGAASTVGAGTALPAAAKVPQPGDILQLVQQLGHALGGVGPAIEFLKLCNGNAAALAAAVAAVATPAAVAGQ